MVRSPAPAVVSDAGEEAMGVWCTNGTVTHVSATGMPVVVEVPAPSGAYWCTLVYILVPYVRGT